MSILFSIFFMLPAFGSSISGTDITVCRYELPLRIEREVISIDNGTKEICTIHLDKIKNIYDTKKNKLSIKRKMSFKVPGCNIDDNLNSFRLVKKTNRNPYDKALNKNATFTKMSKEYCDQFPPNSLIINY